MSAFGGKADVIQGVAKSPLIAKSRPMGGDFNTNQNSFLLHRGVILGYHRAQFEGAFGECRDKVGQHEGGAESNGYKTCLDRRWLYLL